MALTTALSVASIVATVAGTAVGVMGQAAASRQQAAAAEAAAAAERQRAQQLKQLGDIEYQRRQTEGQKLISKQLAIYGASGIEPTMGTPLVVMEETAAEIERDALMARYKYQLGASSAETSARLMEFRGAATRSALPWQIGGTLLTGMRPLLSQSLWQPFTGGGGYGGGFAGGMHGA